MIIPKGCSNMSFGHRNASRVTKIDFMALLVLCSHQMFESLLTTDTYSFNTCL